MARKKNILKILFAWELLRIIFVFYFTTAIFNSGLDPAYSFLIAFIISPQALIISLIFIGIFSEKEYFNNRKVILTGKIYNLSFLFLLFVIDNRVIKALISYFLLKSTGQFPSIDLKLKAGFFFILILDLIFFFFLLSYKKKESLVPDNNP